MLIQQCYDQAYLDSNADYIISGKITDVSSTSATLSANSYSKGASLGSKITIASYRADEQPIFMKGESVILYLKDDNGTLSVFCGIQGAKRV